MASVHSDEVTFYLLDEMLSSAIYLQILQIYVQTKMQKHILKR
jgi:hypothetical protein